MEQQAQREFAEQSKLIGDAFAQGLLVPLLKFLEQEEQRGRTPIVFDAGWPYARATADGESKEAAKIRMWIMARVMMFNSPDGAQNTEG